MFGKKTIPQVKSFGQLHSEIISFIEKIDEALIKGEDLVKSHNEMIASLEKARQDTQSKIGWLQELRKAFPAAPKAPVK